VRNRFLIAALVSAVYLFAPAAALAQTAGIGVFPPPNGSGGGVSTVSCGNLSPLFTCAVTNPTTTPAIAFALSAFPDTKVFPAANCVNSTAGAAWNTDLSPGCFGGSNNLGGYLPFADASTAQFETELPLDWDTASQPYIRLFFTSGANTTGTVIFTVATACYASDGSTSTDPSFATAQTFSTSTMAAASRGWSQGLQLNAVSSANNCVAGGSLLVKITRTTDTAPTAAFVTKAVLTIPRLIAVQAN
jgi:hypothetical protein